MITHACVQFHAKDGKIYEIPCHRHADAFYIISQFVRREDIDKSKTWQGFITHDDMLLDRYDAMKHAIACGQVPNTIENECKELYSEDLW